jgi:hypothetical protein
VFASERFSNEGPNREGKMTVAILASNFMPLFFICQLGSEGGILHCHNSLGVSTTV